METKRKRKFGLNMFRVSFEKCGLGGSGLRRHQFVFRTITRSSGFSRFSWDFSSVKKAEIASRDMPPKILVETKLNQDHDP